MPAPFKASEEFKGKKVVIVSVPGAFTPGCQAFHIPPYMENINKIAEKGVDMVVVIASNDAFVMSAWGKVNGATKDSKVKFMSDVSTCKSRIAVGYIDADDRLEQDVLQQELRLGCRYGRQKRPLGDDRREGWYRQLC